jgi:hypothetical protein
MERLFEICETAFSIVTVLFGSMFVAMLISVVRSPGEDQPEYRAKFWIIASTTAGATFSWIYDSAIPAIAATTVIVVICATPWARR